MTLRDPILVFDLDGTLADTARDLVGTLNVLLQREGLPSVGLGAARYLVGAGARALIERGFTLAGVPLSVAETDRLVKEFLAYYENHIADETRLFPGAEMALKRFSEAGYLLAICTNKPENLARVLLEKLSVSDYFAAICGRGSFEVHKPDPRMLSLTIQAAGGDPARAIMVGDSKTDVDTAKNMATPIIAVDFGYSDKPIALLEPDRIISHFDELWEAVRDLHSASLS